MHSDCGPSPGQRGCCFLENADDHGGWYNLILWAEYLNLPPAAYLWWLGWRYTSPEDAVQWPDYMADDVLNQIGERTHLEMVSNPAFEPSGPRFSGADFFSWTHGVPPAAQGPLN